jgi:hypothetical protein
MSINAVYIADNMAFHVKMGQQLLNSAHASITILGSEILVVYIDRYTNRLVL